MFTAFHCHIPNRRWDLWPRCIRLRPKIKGIRTEPEVECIEARTRIKTGAPVCSDSLLCSLSNEPWIGPVALNVENKTKTGLSLTVLFSVITPHPNVFSPQTSDEPLIPIGQSHSLPPSRSSPCHISPLQQNKATPPPTAAAAWRQPLKTFGSRPRIHIREGAARGRCALTKTKHFSSFFFFLFFFSSFFY